MPTLHAYTKKLAIAQKLCTVRYNDSFPPSQLQYFNAHSSQTPIYTTLQLHLRDGDLVEADQIMRYFKLIWKQPSKISLSFKWYSVSWISMDSKPSAMSPVVSPTPRRETSCAPASTQSPTDCRPASTAPDFQYHGSTLAPLAPNLQSTALPDSDALPHSTAKNEHY